MSAEKPWLQRPDETDKAYAAFEAYIQKRDHTLLDAYLGYVGYRYDDEKTQRAKRQKAKSSGCAPGHIGRWSSQYDWVRRRKAYYRHIDEQAYDELMESKKRRKVERIELLDEVFEEAKDKLGPALRGALRGADVHDIATLVTKLLREYRAELDELPTQTIETAGADEVAAMLGVEIDGDDS